MNEFKKILESIKRPFQLEIKNGCQDNAVVGGFEEYISIWTQKANALLLKLNEQKLIGELNGLFENYSNLSPAERGDRLQKAAELIENFGGSAAVVGKEVGQLPLFATEQTKGKKHAPKAPFSALKQESTPPIPTESEPEDIISDEEVPYDVTLLEFLATPIQYSPGIGPRRADLLRNELNIHNIGDALEYYPRDYLDRSDFKEIYYVGRSGDYETIQGKVVSSGEFMPKRGKMKIGKFKVYDGTAVAALVTFGRRVDYLKRQLKDDTKVVVSGKFKRDYGEIQTTEFEYEVLSDEDADLIHTGRIVPKYSLTAKLTQRSLRSWIKMVVDEYADGIPEVLPLELRKRMKLIDKSLAVKNLHFPDSDEKLKTARKRLAFDELFFLELGLGLRKRRVEIEELGVAFKSESKLLKDFSSNLPFELTNAQKRVFAEIREDMTNAKPMNRLLQGDVGSGKTIVAAMALILASDSGYQCAMMAPTEILAEQHYQTLSSLFEPIGIRVALLKSDMPKKEKEEYLEAINNGDAHIAVGTHALIQEGVEFDKLGFVIIDEQHRFGVMQRAELRSKGIRPDVLVMTATPIPRTLALTIYGDLNVSTIDELPPGRQKIETKWVSEEKRGQLYKFIEKQIADGRQAYIVYPLVEESEKLEDIKAATEMAEHFQNEVFPNLRVGLIHGRMRASDKQDIMESFKNRQMDILVSTTVIEVGIDVPNASIMLIEHAERFGLAQLHQLRGRVGRSSHKSYCLLIADPKNEDGLRPVKVMVRTNDGFEIAEEDLEIRGPGEFFGTRQAGMPDLKVANIFKDTILLEQARKEAFKIAEIDPSLKEPQHQMMKAVLKTTWRENLRMASIG